MKTVFVTGNKGKFDEAKAVFPEMEMLDEDLPEIQSLELNEIIREKLLEATKKSGGIECRLVVEDTSLVIKGMGSLPGPLIKWFIKELGSEGVWNMSDKLGAHEAIAETSVGVYDGKDMVFFKDSIAGKIVYPRGEKGFGWDSIFELVEGAYAGNTLAELSAEQKNEISMRRKVFEKLKESVDENQKNSV